MSQWPYIEPLGLFQRTSTQLLGYNGLPMHQAVSQSMYNNGLAQVGFKFSSQGNGAQGATRFGSAEFDGLNNYAPVLAHLGNQRFFEPWPVLFQPPMYGGGFPAPNGNPYGFPGSPMPTGPAGMPPMAGPPGNWPRYI